MRWRVPLMIVSAVSVPAVLAGVGFGAGSPNRPEADPGKTYTLQVEGTAGARLDMLLITKPTAETVPTREQARITVPFSREFSAARCYVWFDTLPDGSGGPKGASCRITLKAAGAGSQSRAETTMQPDLFGGTSGLGDL